MTQIALGALVLVFAFAAAVERIETLRLRAMILLREFGPAFGIADIFRLLILVQSLDVSGRIYRSVYWNTNIVDIMNLCTRVNVALHERNLKRICTICLDRRILEQHPSLRRQGESTLVRILAYLLVGN